jgi:hypothetical protein
MGHSNETLSGGIHESIYFNSSFDTVSFKIRHRERLGGKLSFNGYRNIFFNVMHLPTVLFIYPRKTYPPPVPVLCYLSLSGQIKHELEMCELRRYFENYCREIEAKYRHELEDTVLSSSRITRTLPAITRSLILLNYLVLRSRKYFFWLRLQLLHEYFGGLWISFFNIDSFIRYLENYCNFFDLSTFLRGMMQISSSLDKIVRIRSRSQSRNS